MRFVDDARRFSGAASLVIMGLGVSGTALLFVIHPAAAASALAAVQSAVTCAATGTGACVSGTNTSSGIGVLGASNTGTGVRGSANTNYGMKGSSGSSYGVFGTSTTGFAGVAGTTNGKSGQNGVYGYTTGSSGGYGVKGSSEGDHGAGLVGLGDGPSGWGVLGIAERGTGVEADAFDGGIGFLANVTGSATGLRVSAATGTGVDVATAGVYGVVSRSTNANGYAVYGYNRASGGGIGVLGTSLNAGSGVQGQAGSGGIGVHALSSGGYGFKADSVGGGTGLWVNMDSSGTGVYVNGGYAGVISVGTGQGGYFSGPNQGVLAYSGAGNSIQAGSQNGTTFSVDQYGNVSYSGNLVSNARSAGGTTVTAFSAKTTAPTVEDTGTAQLVAGSAVVRLDPTFAASIDQTTTYRVFVTPGGDMPHGLFVALKSPNGFMVREMQGGRSSVTFDYRIVATALGHAGQRMAFANTLPKMSVPAPPPIASSADARRAAPAPPPLSIPAPLPKGISQKAPPAP